MSQKRSKGCNVFHSERRLHFSFSRLDKWHSCRSIYIHSWLLTDVCRVLASMGRLPSVLERERSLVRHSSMTMKVVLDVEMELD